MFSYNWTSIYKPMHLSLNAMNFHNNECITEARPFVLKWYELDLICAHSTIVEPHCTNQCICLKMQWIFTTYIECITEARTWATWTPTSTPSRRRLSSWWREIITTNQSSCQAKLKKTGFSGFLVFLIIRWKALSDRIPIAIFNGGWPVLDTMQFKNFGDKLPCK